MTVSKTGTRPDNLYHVEGNILENEKCIDVPEGYPDTNFDPELNVCADDLHRGGDSGGPLLSKSNAEYAGVGLVSRRLIDAGQYTRIAFYRNWIALIMSGGTCNKFESLENNLLVCNTVPVKVK